MFPNYVPKECLLVQDPILNLSMCVRLNPAKVLPCANTPFNNNESAVLNVIGPVKANGEKKVLFLFLH